MLSAIEQAAEVCFRMAQTPAGAAKIAAKKAGLDVGDYLDRCAAGLKRCTACKEWHSISTFNADASRFDGRAAKGQCCSRVAIRMSTKGRTSTFLGKSHTAEARAAMSSARVGKPGKRLGIKHTIETRAKISRVVRERAPRGENCPAYVDGRHAERMNERLTDVYKRWRYDVMLRDHFTCQHCGDARGGNLHAHHIKPFATHPELRLDLSNGVTLCETCHKAVHAAA